MKANKRKKLEAKGWKSGSATDFLGLTEEEAAYVELKVKLALALKDFRTKHRLTQQQVAERIESSQSRVAKMETGDPSVSIDLIIRSLLMLGATHKDIAKTLSGSKKN